MQRKFEKELDGYLRDSVGGKRDFQSFWYSNFAYQINIPLKTVRSSPPSDFDIRTRPWEINLGLWWFEKEKGKNLRNRVEFDNKWMEYDPRWDWIYERILEKENKILNSFPSSTHQPFHSNPFDTFLSFFLSTSPVLVQKRIYARPLGDQPGALGIWVLRWERDLEIEFGMRVKMEWERWLGKMVEGFLKKEMGIE